MSLPTKNTANTVKAYLEKNKSGIVAAMPRGANYERACRTVINAISTTPALAQCTVDSLFLACVKAFSVGIEPNGPTMEGYIVPFKGRAQFMPSYRGLISLARRSGMVSLVYADAIREGDKYKISRGTDLKLEHEPALERGKAVAYYAVAKMSDGTMDFEIMVPSEIDHIRGKSRAADDGPWVTDFDEMAKKTVIKRLAKRLPVSVENLAFARAVNADNEAESGLGDIIDIEGIEVPKRESPFEQKPETTTEPPPVDFASEKPQRKKAEPAEIPMDDEYPKLISGLTDAAKAAGLTVTDIDNWAADRYAQAFTELPVVTLRNLLAKSAEWLAEVKGVGK